MGLDYQLIPVDLIGGEHQQPAFLKLNPLGQVPVLVEGESLIRDSQAILVYLARNYGNDSWLPLEAEAMGRIMQWLSLSASEIRMGLEAARLYHLLGFSEINIHQATQKANETLKIIDHHLEGREWLAGDNPTIADVACYPYIYLAEDAQIDLQPYPNVETWLKQVQHLPGYIAMEGEK